MRMRPVAAAAVAAVLAVGCSDNSSADLQKLQREVADLNGQLRQYRAEIQRSNEKIVAMLQQHGLQSDTPTLNLAPREPGEPANLNMAASKALLEANTKMAQAMTAEPLTGDPDRDFLAQMIPHHVGAVDMSRILLQSGTRPEIKQFAQAIIAHQQAEIVMMRAWLDLLKK